MAVCLILISNAWTDGQAGRQMGGSVFFCRLLLTDDYTYQSAGRARRAGAASGAGNGAANAGRANKAGAAKGAPRRVLQVVI